MSSSASHDADLPEAPSPGLRLGRKLGAGGMGVVYEVIDPVNGTRLAAKTVQHLPESSPDYRVFADEVKDPLRFAAVLSPPVGAAPLGTLSI